MKSRKIGLLGGTFNPVHTGHLVLAADAIEAHGLDQVWFVPCAKPPHKPERELAAADDRVAMLERAIADEPAFAVSRVELDRPGISFAIDTVQTLVNAHPDVAWHFIIGADTLPELASWHRIKDLLPLCRFITMRRPGWPDQSALRQAINLPAPWPDRLIADVFVGHLIDISSSEIRKRVAQNRTIRYLVPRNVEAYICEHTLYRKGA